MSIYLLDMLEKLEKFLYGFLYERFAASSTCGGPYAIGFNKSDLPHTMTFLDFLRKYLPGKK